MKIAFDVDGTLIQKDPQTNIDTPRYSVLQMMFLLKTFGCDIFVWSGSGVEYAKRWCEKLGIDSMVTVVGKGMTVVDLCFDDQETDLAKVNIRV